MTQKEFGWCFIGAGSIADRVYADFPQMNNTRVVTVYNRSAERGEAFARKSGATYCASLQEAVTHPAVDAVYVATTNQLHCEHTLAALACGKPVLCEKPFALSGSQAQQMIDHARERKLYLMEGMWMRFNPAIAQALRWIEEGRIGPVRALSAAFNCISTDLSSRVYNLGAGGGGLMDLGVYAVALAQFVFGEKPQTIRALAAMHETGVDRQCAILLQYPSGAIARLICGLELPADNAATIVGAQGYIQLPRFVIEEQAQLHTPDAAPETYLANKRGEGFYYQFNAVMEDIRGGRTENALVSHAYTLDVMDTLDQIRNQIGLIWPKGVA